MIFICVLINRLNASMYAIVYYVFINKLDSMFRLCVGAFGVSVSKAENFITVSAKVLLLIE